jgi:hypothetical protein
VRGKEDLILRHKTKARDLFFLISKIVEKLPCTESSSMAT